MKLSEAIETFEATGGGALLMNVNNGDIISLVSFPTLILIKGLPLKIVNILIRLLKEFMNLDQFSRLLLLL